MSHRYHPNPEVNDPTDAILFDDCQDCGYKARQFGLDLDEANWQQMWDKMLAVELNHPNGYINRYSSEAEALLGKQMYRMYVALERYTAIDPKTLFAPWRLV